MNPITIDFETEAIEGNPVVHSPRAVGVAVWVPGQEPTYLAWGHPSENNCTFAQAHEYLQRIRDSGHPLLFHNAGFDVSVIEHQFCNARIQFFNNGWRRIHDTMYLLFLADPYAATLSLKPSADRYLGMAATEQDELYRWILQNVPEATKKTSGAFIARAPGDLVGRYAIGDVVRTRKLFDLLHGKISTDGMGAAYEREQHLFPTLWMGTQRGIRIDRETLEWHESVYAKCLDSADSQLAVHLGCPLGALSSDESLADALEKSGAVKEWVLTPKSGKRSMSRENLKIIDPKVKMLMDYRGALSTCLSTFMRPWLEFSREDGRLHPNWNQVKRYREGGSYADKIGTQTGRLSSDSPNFQNVPTEFTDLLGAPLPVPEGLHPLPCLRRYCLPEDGHVWLKRDFSSQEIRILAHFEDASLCEAYRANPGLDPHKMAQGLIHELTGVLYDRRPVKITGFSLIYGTGVNGLSHQLGESYDTAYRLKHSYFAAMPGVERLMRDVQRRGESGQPIRTWGGRIYYTEPPKVSEDGRIRSFAYKLLNYLIQGSAADQTKQSIIDWNEDRRQDLRSEFLATVHDELNISAPIEHAALCMEELKVAMNKDRFDVPFLSDGFSGSNWEDIKEYT